jgi:hypothetical protein
VFGKLGCKRKLFLCLLGNDNGCGVVIAINLALYFLDLLSLFILDLNFDIRPAPYKVCVYFKGDLATNKSGLLSP